MWIECASVQPLRPDVMTYVKTPFCLRLKGPAEVYQDAIDDTVKHDTSVQLEVSKDAPAPRSSATVDPEFKLLALRSQARHLVELFHLLPRLSRCLLLVECWTTSTTTSMKCGPRHVHKPSSDSFLKEQLHCFRAKI